MERSIAFLLKMEDLVKQVVAYNHIPCYRVDSSFETQHTPNGEQVEIPVIRVVGFFEDTIPKITTVLNTEFELYQIAYAGNEGFGTTTKAYLANLRPNRMELPEYNILEPHKFDIYVSSILQDVYSAMHRNLTGAGNTLPEDLKRDFYRIGAFLEMADIEFIKIRNKVSNGEYDLSDATMVHIPVVERPVYTPVTPQTKQAAETTIVAEPVPAHQPVAQSEEVQVTATTASVSEHIPHIESMEMNVDSFDALAVSIGNIDTSNGVSSNDYFDLLTSSHHQKQSDSYDLLSSVQNAPPAQVELPVAETPKTIPPVAEVQNTVPVPTVAIPEIPTSEEVTNNREDEVVHHEPILSEATKPTQNETPKTGFSTPGEGVALNIDKIDTFNMNVSGMIERTTEIIREVPTGTNASAVAAAATGAIDNVVPAAASTPSTMPLPVSSSDKVQDEGPLNMDENIQMSDAMLREYVRTSDLVKEIDRAIAERAGARINEEVDIEGDVERLRFLKVNTMRQLTERLMDNKEDIVSFAEKWIGKDNGGSFDSGICLFYLEYLLVGKRNDPAFSVEYVLKFISDNDYSARYIIPTYNAVRHAAGEPASSNFAHLTLK